MLYRLSCQFALGECWNASGNSSLEGDPAMQPEALKFNKCPIAGGTRQTSCLCLVCFPTMVLTNRFKGSGLTFLNSEEFPRKPFPCSGYSVSRRLSTRIGRHRIRSRIDQFLIPQTKSGFRLVANRPLYTACFQETIDFAQSKDSQGNLYQKCQRQQPVSANP